MNEANVVPSPGISRLPPTMTLSHHAALFLNPLPLLKPPYLLLTTMWFLQRASIVAFASTASRRSLTSTTTRLSAAAGPPKQFLLRYDYIPDVLEKRGPYREGHLQLAKDLMEEGRCLSGGPSGPVGAEVPTGALFVFTDLAAAECFVEGDPYVSNGIVTGHSIEEWTVVLQKE